MDEGLGFEKLRLMPGERSPLRRAEGWEIVVAAGPGACLCFQGKDRPLESGGAAAFLPGEVREIFAAPDCAGPAGAYRLRAGPAWAAGRSAFLESLAAATPARRCSVELGAEARAALERKVRIIEDAAGDAAAAAAAGPVLESLFVDLALEFRKTERERRGEGAPLWLRRACLGMEKERNLRRGGVRLAELAGKAPEHVSREMRRWYGQTPTEFVNDLRLARASRLLAASELPVLDIAWALGYESPSYFARIFRERYGAPPLRWRTGVRP